MDEALKAKIAESQAESGFSVKGFSRRDFGIMLLICQDVLLDDDLLEKVNPLSKFKGHPLELSALTDKINTFLD